MHVTVRFNYVGQQQPLQRSRYLLISQESQLQPFYNHVRQEIRKHYNLKLGFLLRH